MQENLPLTRKSTVIIMEKDIITETAIVGKISMAAQETGADVKSYAKKVAAVAAFEKFDFAERVTVEILAQLRSYGT